MKYLPTIAFLLISTFIIFSCKSDNADGSTDEIVNKIGVSNPDVDDARNRAEEKLIGTNKEGFYSSLINTLWDYDVVVKGTGPVDSYKGFWISFDEDQSYVQGKEDKDLEKGKWNYNPSNELLTLLPKDKASMPREFRLMPKANTIICVGTADFKNNDTQMKWVRRQDTNESE